jgi:acyl-CoA reductase-like NAD-dependent aldehyde dehydrogenase
MTAPSARRGPGLEGTVPGLYIDGSWTTATEGEQADVLNPPYDQSVVAKVDYATAVDVDRAVAAARTAFDQGLCGAPRCP